MICCSKKSGITSSINKDLKINIYNIYMNNPLIKNNKTWLFNDLKDRTSHYNKILCAKSLYDSEPPKR